MQTNMVKTADARVKNNRNAPQVYFQMTVRTKSNFSSEHVGKMHDKGASLDQIYKWASGKFGDVDTSLAFRALVQFQKDARVRLVVVRMIQILTSIAFEMKHTSREKPNCIHISKFS